MVRSSLALFLASTSLIAGLSGCGGEGTTPKPDGAADGVKPSLGTGQGGSGAKPAEEGGEGGEGGEN